MQNQQFKIRVAELLGKLAEVHGGLAHISAISFDP